MKFVVLADDENYKLLTALAPDANWTRVSEEPQFLKEKEADAFFNLREDADHTHYAHVTVPVFINSVIATLTDLNTPANVIRFNAWHGFPEKNTWEAAGNISPAAEAVFEKIGKKCIAVNDEPGFVSARIISMIINEAFFAKGENISSEQEIDIAMKLGTNYPYGPFEWGRLIGIRKVYELLNKLSVSDIRYTPAPALRNACNIS